MKKVRLGIVGLGNMGIDHLQTIADGLCPEIEVTAVADAQTSRFEAAKKIAPQIAAFADAEEMMDSGLIDAVLVAIPHYFHADCAIKAMKRGLHVMVEKPAGVYAKQAREMNEAADAFGVTFGMMFNQRTNHIFRKMKEIMDSGELGEMKRAVWIVTDWLRTQFYYDSGAWRATWKGEGGGVLLNQCPHQLDLFQWICGLPVRVDAHLHYGKWHNIEVEDDVTAYLEFANGATGCFITTTGEAPGTSRFEIDCEKGKLVAENNKKLTMWKLSVGCQEWIDTTADSFSRPECVVTEVETDGFDPEHSAVLNAFAANILRGEPLVADGREGIRGLQLSNAMHMSSFLGKTVEIPVDEEQYLVELNKRIAVSKKGRSL